MEGCSSSFFTDVVDYAMSNGILMKTTTQEISHMPLTIFPTPVSKRDFQELIRIQPLINKIFYLASIDHAFLIESMKSLLEAEDEFSRNLFNIYQEAKSCSIKSDYDLGILRADYMFDSRGNEEVPKQIEVNTIAAGCCGIGGNRLVSVHAKALREANRSHEIPLIANNPSADEVARGLVEGWKAYGSPHASITFLVMKFERNIFDQLALEHAINAVNDKIVVRRRTFEDLLENTKVLEDGKLFIKDEEVAVIYFRTGYCPKNYPSQKHWNARLTIEKSKAIKCPSVAFQLTGCKKFQEVLARPGSVERFIKDEEDARAIRKTFVGLYTLEMTAEGDRSVEIALASPESYVMKPQREGGGNNIFGQDIIQVLREIGNNEKRAAYILMDRIRPKSAKKYIASKQLVSESECVNELGIFGVYLAKNGDILQNRSAGYLLRTKLKDTNEGGLMTNSAFLDSPLLV